MMFNDVLLNKFIAPEITRFTDAAIPDITSEFPEASHWLQNHFLNNVFRWAFDDRARQVVLGYLRRAHHAFGAYHQARETTLRYLDGNQPDNPRVRGYYEAIALWEMFAIQIGMALDLVKWMGEGRGVFSKNDGSSESRLYSIANQVKHVASCVETGQCGTHESVPVWLTNTGLQSYGLSVSFAEAADVLRRTAELADQLQDPKKFVDGRTGARTS
jgi:hypothetical protein